MKQRKQEEVKETERREDVGDFTIQGVPAQGGGENKG